MTVVWLNKLGTQFRAGKYGTDLVFTTLHRLLTPYSRRENEARREYIFNVIALALIGVTGIMFVAAMYLAIIENKHNGISVWLSSGIASSLLLLFGLGKTKYRRLARQIFLVLLLVPCLHALATGGLLLAMPLLGCALIIVMASILHNARTALFYTVGISASLALIHWSQLPGLTPPNQSWIFDPTHDRYWIELSSILFALLIVTWLVEREIMAAQKRAKLAEETLRQERDQLEIRLEERTNQLVKIHSEQTANLLKLAQYGQEFAGYFHDLVNPITAASISIEKVSQNPGTKDPLLDKADSAMHTVINFVRSVQKQLQKEAKPEPVNLAEVVTQATEIVQHKIQHQNIIVHAQAAPEGTFVMDPIKLFQIISNLLNNAVEACSECSPGKIRQIWLKTKIEDRSLLITVTDTGPGIPEHVRSHIFDPLTTARKGTQHLGLGLSIIRHIVTQQYGGTVEIIETGPQGTTFSVRIPEYTDS